MGGQNPQPSFCAKFKSLSEANMKLQHPNESNQVDIFQRYSLFSAKVPLFVTILPPAAQQGNTVRGNTKREFDAKKTVNVSDIHLI